MSYRDRDLIPDVSDPLNAERLTWLYSCTSQEARLRGEPGLVRDLCGRCHAQRHGSFQTVPTPYGMAHKLRDGLTFLAQSPDLLPPPRGVIACTFKLASRRDYVLLHKGDGRTYTDSSFFLGRYCEGAGDVRLGFWVNNGSGWLRIFAANDYADGQWHRVAAGYADGLYWIAVDGADVVVQSQPRAFVPPESARQPWEWGHYGSLSRLGPPDLLADMTISARIWSPADIESDYQQSSRGYPTALRFAGKHLEHLRRRAIQARNQGRSPSPPGLGW